MSRSGPPQAYWVQMSRNDLLRALLKQSFHQKGFQDLFQGKWIAVEMNPLISLDDFQGREDRSVLQWTLLAATGYLTLRPTQSAKSFEVRLPNREVAEALSELLKQFLVQEHHWVAFTQPHWEQGFLWKARRLCVSKIWRNGRR